jgi:hypothetical protein
VSETTSAKDFTRKTDVVEPACPCHGRDTESLKSLLEDMFAVSKPSRCSKSIVVERLCDHHRR